MNDIRPPRRPLNRPQPPTQPPQPSQYRPTTPHPPAVVHQPTSQSGPSTSDLDRHAIEQQVQSPVKVSKPRPRRKKIAFKILGVLFGVLLLCLVGGFGWYQTQLAAVKPGSSVKRTIEISSGSSPRAIGQKLKQQNLIKNSSAFELYLRLTGAAADLQAGKHVLSPSMDVPAVVAKLSDAEPNEITLTFLPGATVAQNKKVLADAGYSNDEIDTAFAQQYSHPVFKDKPASADLEGYIYGETYNFSIDATVGQILTRTFDELYKTIESEKLIEGYQARGFTLYEGITLASIIQREVITESDEKQVAQVFLLRYEKDIPLGSDVTYQYIADKTGVARDTELDSPYNTRRYPGLPPGPISAPGKGALYAVAHPADGDYLYFLSGDDDITYFAKTEEGHQTNIREHCQEKCKIL